MPDDSVPSRRRFLTGRIRGERPVWRPVPTAGANPNDVLWGVWCDGPGYALVVGDGGAIHRLSGGVWRREESGVKEPLHAVVGFGGAAGEDTGDAAGEGTGDGSGDDAGIAAGDDAGIAAGKAAGRAAVAVGWMGVIVHWDGTAWRRHGGGIVDPVTRRFARTRANTPLFGLWAASPDDVWAVGDEGRVCRFDGTAWHEVPCPSDAHLRAVVHCPDGTLMVAGAQGTVLAYRDGAWSQTATGTSSHLTGLHVDDDGTVLAAGGRFDAGRNGFAGTLLRLREGTWTALPADEPLPRLRSIARIGDTLVAAGDHGTVARVEGDRIVPERSGTRRDLYALAPAGDRRALCVGDGGVVMERAPASGAELPVFEAGAAAIGRASPWQTVAGSPTDRVLWSVWGHGDRIFAVGDEGAIVTFDGGRWIGRTAPSPLHLHGVWGRHADQVYAVGDFATVIEFDGSHWREIHRLGIDVSAVAVAGFGPHDLFVVGDEGLILRSDGAGFERVDGRTRDALYSIWGHDADHVLAVGDFGAVLRWNGREWNGFSAGTEAFLYGVCGRALDDVVVVGLSGTTAHFDGRRWSRRATGTTADLLGVAPLDDVRWLAVGTRGTALVWDGDAWTEEETGTDAGLRAVWVARDGTAWAVGDGGVLCKRLP